MRFFAFVSSFAVIGMAAASAINTGRTPLFPSSCNIFLSELSHLEMVFVNKRVYC